MSNKQICRARCAHIQKLYRIKRKNTANTILQGHWREAYRGINHGVENVERYWADIYVTPTNGECQMAPPCRENRNWKVLAPITAEDVKEALNTMGNTTPGMDRLTAKEVSRWHLPSIASMFNLFLAAEILPETLASARVTLLPKMECPNSPSDFRPIAIASVLACALHKVISRRMREEFALQYAFLQRDGCLEASSLLHAILRKTQDEIRPLAATFLNLAKAFDTISHQAILNAAEKAGTPPPLLRYLNHLQYTPTQMYTLDL